MIFCVFKEIIIILNIKQMSYLTEFIENRKDKLDWKELSKNHGAITFLEKYPHKIKWNNLMENSNIEELYYLNKNIFNNYSVYLLLFFKIEEIENNYFNKINWNLLSMNPNAIKLLINNIDKINWNSLSSNPNIHDFVKKIKKKYYKNSRIYLEKLNWSLLSLNPNAIELLTEYPDKIYWENLFKNKSVYLFYQKNEKIFNKVMKNNINTFLLSTNPYALPILLEDKKYICWYEFSKLNHPDAIELLKINPNKIDWNGLSENTHPEAIELLEQNLDKINWYSLSSNPSAIHILKQNINKIDWKILSSNSNAFNLLSENLNKINLKELSKNTCKNLWDNSNEYILK